MRHRKDCPCRACQDRETRKALTLCLGLLNQLRGRIRNTYEPSWQLAMSSLFVMRDQHDGKYLGEERVVREGRW